MRVREKADRGFTLIETLVAFVILAFSLGALLTVFSDSLRVVRAGEEYAHAVALAEQRFVEFDAAEFDGVGVEEDVDESGYHWRIETTPMDSGSESAEKSGFTPVSVTVNVSWGGIGGRSISFHSIRLAPR